MHLLIVSPNLPQQGGGANTRNYHLLQALASKHSVSLLALVERRDLEAHEDIASLKQLTTSLTLIERQQGRGKKRWQQLFHLLTGQSYIVGSYLLPEIQQALHKVLSQQSYDGVLFESILMAGYALPAHLKVLIDQHNLEYEILERTCSLEKNPLRRWYNRRESELLKPIEIERCKKADAVLVTSKREQEILQHLLPRQWIETVPNGVDTELFSPNENEQEEAKRIVFTGAMDYYPNEQAVLSFAQNCWPLMRQHMPDITWQIVGRKPSEAVRNLGQLPGVLVTGSVPDVRPYLARAAVALAPLQIGSGTRLKILEALALRKAVVTTSIGCEGIDVVSGTHLLIANSPEDFAVAVVQLLQQPDRRKALGDAGRELVETHYSWKQSSERILSILEHVWEKEQICY